jgi:hypothetical protein
LACGPQKAIGHFPAIVAVFAGYVVVAMLALPLEVFLVDAIIGELLPGMFPPLVQHHRCHGHWQPMCVPYGQSLWPGFWPANKIKKHRQRAGSYIELLRCRNAPKRDGAISLHRYRSLRVAANTH